MKTGDLIYCHGRNSIALVINVDTSFGMRWVCLLEAGDEVITHDDLEDGYIIIDDKWNWPEWHINHRDNI